MNQNLSQRYGRSLLDDAKTYKKLEFNYRKNKEQDQTLRMDALGASFDYEACKDEYWNPEAFSLFYKTPLWDESTPAQRVKLNQLFWVAYYSQIISAEIATIFFNQTSAAALYSIEDFRVVCDTLDLESAQERAHIATFKKISEQFEEKVFGERLFTYPMRTPFSETMIFHDTGPFREFWKRFQLRVGTLLSSDNAFIGCQYFTVRGLRTLNGKLIQHQLSQFYSKNPNKETAPGPSEVSYRHFLDESFHFNSSTVIGLDVVNTLKSPTKFEKFVVNQMLRGCQKDHSTFSTAINGIFWYDPALYKTTERLLRSPIFGMDAKGSLEMMRRCFTEESEGMHLCAKSHQTSIQSYKEYLAPLKHIDPDNHEMRLMSRGTIEKHLYKNRREFKRYAAVHGRV